MASQQSDVGSSRKIKEWLNLGAIVESFKHNEKEDRRQKQSKGKVKAEEILLRC